MPVFTLQYFENPRELQASNVMGILHAGGSLFFMSHGGTSYIFKWLFISTKLKLEIRIINFSTKSAHSYWITCHISEVQLWAGNLKERLARRDSIKTPRWYCTDHKTAFHSLLSHSCTHVCPVYSLTQKRSHKTPTGQVWGCRFVLFHYCLACHLTYLLGYVFGLGRAEGLVWNLCCF